QVVRQVQAGGDRAAARAAAALVEPAREAFVSAMHVTAVFTAGAALVAAFVVLMWLPGRRQREADEHTPRSMASVTD
ncbi:MAG TPA: hypothetical protein VGD09_06910, partial [Blastococcus sp.]